MYSTKHAPNPMSTNKHMYDDDDALLVVPAFMQDIPEVQQRPPFPFAPDILTADDFIDHVRAMLTILKKNYRAELVWQFVPECFEELDGFTKARGFSPKVAPIGERIFPLYSRELFPPKAHQVILRHVGAMFGVCTLPKKVSTGRMQLSYTGVNLYSRLLDALGSAVLPLFDADLRAAYRSCTIAERPQHRDRLVAEYVGRIFYSYVKHSGAPTAEVYRKMVEVLEAQGSPCVLVPQDITH